MASIYQRARPRRFDEVVGQEHVKDILLAALRRDQVGHAYLFSGPRGVGKTTSARLLAMAVNCDAAPDQRPCGVCESCRLVQAGQHPDVTELDAASNNSVDDVRDLREKVRLASLRGGRRVWVLDEAHMLSRAAANALLKTLEEPPPGLVFVLATTEPEKLPPTVLSRCQHFRFRRLSEDQIRSKMERLCLEAGLEAEPEALALVARAADGAMRDAESLLERLLLEGERITLAQTEATLGLPPLDRLNALSEALMGGDWSPLLLSAAELYRDGFAPRTVVEQLARHLRDQLYRQLTTDDAEQRWAPRTLVQAIDVLDGASERFVRQGDLYALEVTLLRAARAASGSPAAEDAGEAAAMGPSAAPPASTATRTQAPATAPVQRSATSRAAATAPAAGGASGGRREEPPAFDPHAPSAPVRGRREPSSQAEATGSGAAAAPAGRFNWHQTKTDASTQLKAFLLPAVAELEEGVLTLRYGDMHDFHFKKLREKEADLLALIDGHGGAGLEVMLIGPSGKLRHPPRAAGGAEPPAAARHEAPAPAQREARSPARSEPRQAAQAAPAAQAELPTEAQQAAVPEQVAQPAQAAQPTPSAAADAPLPLEEDEAAHAPMDEAQPSFEDAWATATKEPPPKKA